MVVFEDGAFKEVTKDKWGHKDGALILQDCLYKKRHLRASLLSLSMRAQWKGLVRTKWPSASEKEPSPETEPCWNLDLGLSSLQNGEKINSYCLSHAVSGILLMAAWAKTGAIWHSRRYESLWSRAMKRQYNGLISSGIYEFIITPIFLTPRVPLAVVSYLGAGMEFSER